MAKIKNRFYELFGQVDPAREELYVAIVTIVLSVMKIDFWNIYRWPNWIYGSAIFISMCTIFFVFKARGHQYSKYDYWRLIADCLLGLNILIYVGQYWYDNNVTIAILFGLTFLLVCFCGYHSARRAMEQEEKNWHSRNSGEMIFDKAHEAAE